MNVISSLQYEKFWVHVDDTKVWEENTATMHIIQIENNLCFDKHVKGQVKNGLLLNDEQE